MGLAYFAGHSSRRQAALPFMWSLPKVVSGHGRLQRQPADDDMQGWLIQLTGELDPVGIRAAVANDVPLVAFDTFRAGSRHSPVALMDDRLKEAFRRHRRARAAYTGTRSAVVRRVVGAVRSADSERRRSLVFGPGWLSSPPWPFVLPPLDWTTDTVDGSG